MTVKLEKFICPYCPHQSASPGGVLFHIKNAHPEKQEEFTEKYYPEMTKRYKKSE